MSYQERLALAQAQDNWMDIDLARYSPGSREAELLRSARQETTQAIASLVAARQVWIQEEGNADSQRATALADQAADDQGRGPG